MTLIERLRSVGGIEGTTRWYINPDGPEAADEIERLQEALKLMVDEKCDYMKINNLGDPEQQHTIKIARAALKGDE